MDLNQAARMAMRMAELTEVRSERDDIGAQDMMHYDDMDKEKFQIEIPSKDMN